MPKRSRNPDANEIAFRVVQESIREREEPQPPPKKKVRLTLLSGKKTQDVNALAKLFKHLTGRDPTPEDLAAAKKTLPKKPAKLRPDVAETAFRVMQEAIGEAPKTLPTSERTEKNADAVQRGRKGGTRGGKSRAKKLSPEARSAIARKAAMSRWSTKG